MIVWNVSRLNFFPIIPGKYQPENDDGTFIELYNIWGKLIYRIEKKGTDLKLNGYTFSGNFDYLKIHRNSDVLIDSFKVELFCKDCQDTIYKLTGKLPLLIKIKTDFHVTKDTR